MTPVTTFKRTRDLVRLLMELTGLHERLAKLTDAKMDAMRRADVPVMRELGEQEEALTRRIHERAGLRRQLADAIAEEAGWNGGSGRDMTVSQMAGRLPEPDRASLLDAAGALRTVVLRVVRANRIAGAAARELIHHLQWVFASVRPATPQPVGYSGNGAVVGPVDTRLFDAVG